MLRRAWPIALVALAFAFAWPLQVTGYNQNAHYALVRALAVHHVPYIDQSRGEIGDLSTGDVALHDGHYYAAKAPGLALVSVPAFLVADAVGMRTTGDPRRIVYVLHLWAIVPAALALALLVRRLGDELDAPAGVAAAVALGVGTLVLPFATLYFSHIPAAALGFGAFAVAFAERRRAPTLWWVALAGLLAGLAVTFEYPLVLAAAVVGVYTLARSGFVRRGLAFAAGGLVGVAPLLAFNWWAFGSPFHIAYEDYYAEREQEVEGAFGFGFPRLSHLVDIVFSGMGLVTLTPIVVAGAVGAVLLARRRRAEALVLIAVVAAYLFYNASMRYTSPFGGLGPPRYLFPLIPFVLLGAAVAFRRFPLTTGALAVVSAIHMTLATATGALAMYDAQWLDRVRARQFAEAGSALVEITGWYSIAPFFLAVGVALVAAVAASRGLVTTVADAALALVALAAWAALALAVDNPSGAPLGTGYVLAVAGAAAAAVLAVVAARRASHAVSANPAPNSTAEQSGHVTA